MFPVLQIFTLCFCRENERINKFLCSMEVQTM
eukprot:UN12003